MMNVVCWDPAVVRELRGELFREHGGADSSLAALRAAAARPLAAARNGLVVELDAARYAVDG